MSGDVKMVGAPKPGPDFVTRSEAEFMAREAAREAATNAIKEVMAAMPGASAPGAAHDGQHFARGLAMALAEISNQGTGKKVVDPATLEKRSRARERMVRLIMDARRDGVRPQYELTATVHLDDQLIVPMWTDNFRIQHRTKIKWLGVPNEAMLPVPGDETATAIYDAFCEAIGNASGTTARLRTVDGKGNYVTPGGHVFEELPPIPKGYENTGLGLEVEAGALPASDTPQTGLEVLGGGVGRRLSREVGVPILGTVVEPARQLVN